MREMMVFGGSESLLSGEDLFTRGFKENCGRCHVESKAFGIYVPDADELAMHLDDAIARMKSEDRTTVMPPGKLLKDRTAPDPVIDLLALLEAWKAAGDSELFPDPRANAGGDAVLGSDPTLAKSFTNLGSCIPSPRIIGAEPEPMDELDAKFAALPDNSSLPLKLSETDMVSMDSEVLARHGVISFAPAYTLWADDAKKMRYVRVPRGTSIEFSASKQDFTIPENTRFYKTFLKEVVDGSGTVGFKKIETRIIVVRHAVEEPGKAPVVKALYGTYAWNEDETEAILERSPLLNGTPFKDHVTWYITDEQQTKGFIDDPGPDGLAGSKAIPEGATLSQKRELAKDELISRRLARHYAIPGSERCLQCHQGGPNGSFILGFLPLQIRRRPMGSGGVIEPASEDELNQLERFISYGLITGLKVEEIDRKVLKLEKSEGERDPRSEQELIAQGYMLGNCAHCHNPKGYATNTAPELAELLNFFPSPRGGIFQFPLERYSPRIARTIGSQTSRMPYISPSVFDNANATQPWGSEFPRETRLANTAPWRSLIYRNIDAPFAYSSSDLAIFPHMPLNTPGFDLRAPRIMAEWMLSIPARSKDPTLEEYLSTEEQNLREVFANEAAYPLAAVQSQLRLELYRKGREQDPPNTNDIIDPSVRPDDPAHLVPESPGVIGIPGRPHWVELDLTDSQVGQWVPRNVSWYASLVEGQPNADPEKELDQSRLVPILQSVHADEALRTFATTPVPLGLWRKKDGCDFSGQKKASEVPRGSFPGDAEWLAKADRDAPVYYQAPGEAVFTMICSNCHGRQADSRGRQADSLLLLTGGGTRVANFRAGLFGPEASPGSNMMSEFAQARTTTVSERDWAMRYLSWMALGGTNRIIPLSILNVVGNGNVFGHGVNRGGAVSANMLSVARSVCGSFLPEDLTGSDTFFSRPPDSHEVLESTRVVWDTGDADLWRSVCTFENPAPVQAVQISKATAPFTLQVIALYPRESYPAGAPVMDHRGKSQPSLAESNRAPWCLQGARAAEPLEAVDAYLGQAKIAPCPSGLSAAVPWDAEAVSKWTLRGAVNAGRSVFQYVDDLTHKRVVPQPDYSQCELLSSRPTQ